MLVSYTLPCHKREADLMTVLPSVIKAANAAPPVEIVIVDYGCDPPLPPLIWPLMRDLAEGVTIKTKRVERDHFHMAHARNVGIKTATGDIVVAFLADQFIGPSFFADVRKALRPGIFLKWIETFACWRQDLLNVGGFDERFRYYGPEGKELSDRLQRNGIFVERFPASCGVDQIKTPDAKKLQHYGVSLTKAQMHQQGMAIWRENQAASVRVANQGEWGQA